MNTQLNSKLLKNILKTKFENIKFSVKKCDGLMTVGFRIEWMNGPSSIEVYDLTKEFDNEVSHILLVRETC